MALASPRSCSTRGCGYWDFFDDDPSMRGAQMSESMKASNPNLIALCKQLRLELRDSQRQFAAEVERRIEEALNLDAVTRVKAGRQKPLGGSPRDLQRFAPDLRLAVPWKKESNYTALNREPTDEPRERREPGAMQAKWAAEWLESADDGELDIYTCLGLSNCFSWTPDTRKILLKAIAVTFLQMVVPLCLLIAELNLGVEAGPADGDIGFRLTGFTLYGYAIFSMYQGASDECRTSLLNMMMHYKTIPMGNWLPLVAGEISNVFTAFVLCFALYSIFTTQTNPADLILNAVAVNFLGDCDGNFVNKDMKEDAVKSFKEFTEDLFTNPAAHVDDPSVETKPVKVIRRLLYFILVAGTIGCSLLIAYPDHSGGEDVFMEFLSNMSEVNNTLTGDDD
mmetsp:Transcript_142887/g.252242  ORF Transcript_142887/g.252242 Transcript_142887/m.252242 type:complete len:395 (+) Transcript_142887:99-1283(+)